MACNGYEAQEQGDKTTVYVDEDGEAFAPDAARLPHVELLGGEPGSALLEDERLSAPLFAISAVADEAQGNARRGTGGEAPPRRASRKERRIGPRTR